MSPEKVWNALHPLSEQSASEFLRILQPGNFKMFLNQLGVPEKRYRHGRDSHVSNVEYTTRIMIMGEGDNGLPGKPEHALRGYLEKTKCLMNSYSHTFRLLPLPNREDIGPLWGDGEFGEDAELTHCVSAEEKTENGATKSFEIYVESSYSGLGNANCGE